MPKSPPSIDTVDDQTVEVLRQRGAPGRLEIAFGMWRSTREIITAILESQHQDWSRDLLSRVDAEEPIRL